MSENILDYEFNLEDPKSRIEQILHNMIDSNYDLEDPKSRTEFLLRELLENMSSGPSVKYMPQNEWGALSFEERQNEGLVLIGDSNSFVGQYYNYENLDNAYIYNSYYSDVVDIFNINDGKYSFHGFYSNTAGDRVTSGGRGGTWDTNDLRFICNGRSPNGYGNYLAFAKTAEALSATNTQYYLICAVDGFDMYVGGNTGGSWHNNTDVSFTHNNETRNLNSLFDVNNYTLFDFQLKNNNTVLEFPESYNNILSFIEVFLNDAS